jgi:hypothetical protein
VPVPPPPQTPLHWQWKVALTLPLEPARVNGPLVDMWPVMGSGTHVWQSVSVPVKSPFPSTVPTNALIESAQLDPVQENVPVPFVVPAGVVVVPVQS